MAGLTVLAFVLRAIGLRQSLFGDELFLYLDVHGRSLSQVFHVVHETEKTPPLGFVLGWLFARGGSADTLVRIPSFVAGVALIPLVYGVGLRTLGRRAAVFAAAWLALDPFTIFYGTETRGYAMVTAFVLLSTFALLHALDGGGRRWWALYVLGATGAVYTHYIGVLVLVPQALWALGTHRGSARAQLLAHAAVVLAFLPWLPSFLVQAGHSDQEASVVDSLQGNKLKVLGDIVERAMAGHPVADLGEIPGVTALVALAVLLAAGVVLGARRRLRPRTADAHARLLLVVALALFAPIAVFAYSLRPNVSFLLPRNVSVALPYAVLIVGRLMTATRSRASSAVALATLAALAVGTVKVVGPDAQRPNARAAAEYLDAHAPPDALVIDQEPSNFDDAPAQATRLYLRRPHRIFPAGDLARVWSTAARRGLPVVVHYHLPGHGPGAPAAFAGFFSPPPPVADRFRLTDEHTVAGFWPIVIRTYSPR